MNEFKQKFTPTFLNETKKLKSDKRKVNGANEYE